MDSSNHETLEARVVDKATHAEHNEGRRLSVASIKKSFDNTNISMVLPDKTHLEVSVDELSGKSIDDITLGWFVWLVAATASIAGSLFGYDTGIISAVLVYLGTDLDGRVTSSGEKELITLLCSGEAFIGAIIAGLTADKFGRKIAIYVGCLLFTAGAIIQGAAYSIAQMSVVRLVVGFGVGSAAMVVPLYIAEIAPTKVRGRFIGLNNMSITGGQVISYGVGAAFAHVPNGWRYMVGLGAVPALVLAALLPFCPESPRQLVYHGRIQEAEVVIAKIYQGATQEQVRNKVALIAAACEEAKELNENQSRWSKIKQLHTVPSNLRALICACGLMVIS
ncbi:Putative major facilitator, sugar transporter, major facilitator superfamily [Septoria linicola]|uniref:Major facilitator, sugar transporter, major facilitator superfamily n=1 Tax=Septoria linicola TaxID=215465 RepID=A0A9Q9EJD0_9PEZI|nr:Putative major facilitator, sugar transporter, major facilitator superfamily [Septoria linicola]